MCPSRKRESQCLPSSNTNHAVEVQFLQAQRHHDHHISSKCGNRVGYRVVLLARYKVAIACQISFGYRLLWLNGQGLEIGNNVYSIYRNTLLLTCIDPKLLICPPASASQISLVGCRATHFQSCFFSGFWKRKNKIHPKHLPVNRIILYYRRYGVHGSDRN